MSRFTQQQNLDYGGDVSQENPQPGMYKYKVLELEQSHNHPFGL